MPETDDRAERFTAWKRDVDADVYDLAGFWPNHAPDHPKFTWWQWFDAELSSTEAAEAVVDVITDEWAARYIAASLQHPD